MTPPPPAADPPAVAPPAVAPARPGDEPNVLKEGLAEAFDWDAALPRTLWHLLTRPAEVARGLIERRRDEHGRPVYAGAWRTMFGLIGTLLALNAAAAWLLGAVDDPLQLRPQAGDQVRGQLALFGHPDPAAGAEATFSRFTTALPVLQVFTLIPLAGVMRLVSGRPFRHHLLTVLTGDNAASLAQILLLPLSFVWPGLYAILFAVAGTGYMLAAFAPLYRAGAPWRTAGRCFGLTAAFWAVASLFMGMGLNVAMASVFFVP